MEVENVVNLVWLDEAFAKGVVDDLEAACCLAGYSQNEIYISDDVPSIYNLYPIDIRHPTVSKIYEIIMSWPNVTRCKPLLWYIDQAIVRNTPYVKYDLILPKCKENKYRQKECIDTYPELAQALGLIEESSTRNDDHQNQQLAANSEIPWRENAKKIYLELGLDKEKMTVEKKAKKVEEEMKKRHAEGKMGMCKRGGKEVPDFESIRRLALSNS